MNFVVIKYTQSRIPVYKVLDSLKQALLETFIHRLFDSLNDLVQVSISC
jgi:hypothetical protein